jgi:twitching motility protein PilT
MTDAKGITIKQLLDSLLAECVALDASDIHMAPGLIPHFRCQGEIRPADGRQVTSADDTRAVAAELLGRMFRHGKQVADLDAVLAARGSIDGAMSAQDGARFRFNVFSRQGEVSIALRHLEDRFRTLEELGMPTSLYKLCDLRDGLVVISGPTGSGKSTTLATLLDRINRTRSGHIITIEDPIEYLHASIRCVVNQRQIGLDAPSFNDALVDSLRQDPDTILVGEIRDLDTIRTAIVAAETGHLVFTTLHAGDCAGAVERLVSVFSADEQDGIRRQLSLVLRGIVAQNLLMSDTADQAPRTACCVAASEILMVTPAVANLIATGKSAQIYSAMETGMGSDMQTLEQDLARLWVAGQISETVAVGMARNPAVLRERVALLRRDRAQPERENGGRNRR